MISFDLIAIREIAANAAKVFRHIAGTLLAVESGMHMYVTVDRGSVADPVTEGRKFVRLLEAPDGLPWYVELSAPPPVETLLGPSATALEVVGARSGFRGTPLEPVARQLRDLLHQSQLVEARGASGTQPARLLPVAVRRLTGPTLLTRLLPPSLQDVPDGQTRPQTPTPAPSPGSDRCPRTNSLPFVRTEDQPAFVPGEQRLAVTTDGKRLLVMRQVRNDAGWPCYQLVRNFRPETLTRLEGATVHPSTGGPVHVGHWSAFASRDIHAHDGAVVRVPRNTLARALLDLTKALAHLHAKGEIHADLKPSNVLVTQAGVVPFDGLGVRPGQRAPAVSALWGAPEQILARPLTFQADQYALGLLALSLLEGVPYGEEIQVRVPTGGCTLQSHTLLRNGGAYVDPKRETVTPDALEPWLAFIERCLRFEPEERFPATLSMVDALRELVGRDALVGYVETALSFGSAAVARREGEDWACPAWVKV